MPAETIPAKPLKLMCKHNNVGIPCREWQRVCWGLGVGLGVGQNILVVTGMGRLVGDKDMLGKCDLGPQFQFCTSVA